MPVPLPRNLLPVPPLAVGGVGAPAARFDRDGIGFVEYNGPDAPSPEVEYGADQTTGRRRLFCLWQFARLAALSFVGYPLVKSVGAAAGGGKAALTVPYVSRNVPHRLDAFGDVSVATQDVLEGVAPTTKLQESLYCVRFRPKGLCPEPSVFRADDYTFSPAGDPVFPPQESVARYVYSDNELTYAVPSYVIFDDLQLCDVILAFLNVVKAANGGTIPSTIDLAAFADPQGPFIGKQFGPDESWLLRYVTRVPKPSYRLVQTPPGTVYLMPDSPDELNALGLPEPILTGFPIYRPILAFDVIWHQVPRANVPWRAIRRCLGAVNKFVFDPFDGAYEPGTVMFAACDPQMGESLAGRRLYNIRYSFLISPNYDLGDAPGAAPVGGGGNYPRQFVTGTGGVSQPRGWNAVLRRVPSTGTLDYRYVGSLKQGAANAPLPFGLGGGGGAGGNFTFGSPPYPYVDFNDLFRPQPSSLALLNQ